MPIERMIEAYGRLLSWSKVAEEIKRDDGTPYLVTSIYVAIHKYKRRQTCKASSSPQESDCSSSSPPSSSPSG
jgi:hypothetical protein